jgi:hypothetical protein
MCMGLAITSANGSAADDDQLGGLDEHFEVAVLHHGAHADFDWITFPLAHGGAYIGFAAVAQGGVQQEVVAFEIAIFRADVREEVLGHLMAEGLLADVASGFFGPVVPKHDALLAVDQVDADREALQDGAISGSSIIGRDRFRCAGKQIAKNRRHLCSQIRSFYVLCFLVGER